MMGGLQRSAQIANAVRVRFGHEWALAAGFRVKDPGDNHPPGSMHTGLKDSTARSDLEAYAKFLVYPIYTLHTVSSR